MIRPSFVGVLGLRKRDSVTRTAGVSVLVRPGFAQAQSCKAQAVCVAGSVTCMRARERSGWRFVSRLPLCPWWCCCIGRGGETAAAVVAEEKKPSASRRPPLVGGEWEFEGAPPPTLCVGLDAAVSWSPYQTPRPATPQGCRVRMYGQDTLCHSDPGRRNRRLRV